MSLIMKIIILHPQSSIIPASYKLIVVIVKNSDPPNFIQPFLARRIMSSHEISNITEFFRSIICNKDLTSVSGKK